MKKKNRLASDYPLDFELIGIVSSAKEYKLAWHINQLPEFHLIKDEDIKIEFSDNKLIRVSNLKDESEFRQVYLLKNKLVTSNSAINQYLLSELQQFDYLLKLSSQTQDFWAKEVNEQLKAINEIDYSLVIDVEKIKMKDNLLF
ncbi:IPExxxVDY family protein [Marinoscillum sp.]|uniref:IPExxxVDY family protein n=1 Tax=Marinoscillum sp. TaxID=2024838 RepID=UPI003BACEB86